MNTRMIARQARRAAQTALLLALAACAFTTPALADNNKALALGWQGYAETDLKFSEFFATDHTVAFRFMAQYPNAYEGPVLAENGTGSYFIGQGDFQQDGTGTHYTNLLVRIGSQSKVYNLWLTPGEWHHVTITAQPSGSSRAFQLYLDGSPFDSPLLVSSADFQMPSGTLRIGKRTTGQTVNGRDAQFYGLVDDVAVFNRVLTGAEIKNLASNAVTLSGSEIGLIAGYIFDDGVQPAKLARPVSLPNWSAKRVRVSDNRSSVDLAAIPLPFSRAELTLPFNAGEAWQVIQQPDTGWVKQPDGSWKEGSHNSISAFAWDFKLNGPPQDGEHPLGTRHAPFFAAGMGGVVAADQYPQPSANANDVEIEQGDREIGTYLHSWPNSFGPGIVAMTPPNQVQRGQSQLAEAGHTGTGDNADHLHYGVKDMKQQTYGRVTFPVAFSNYDLQSADSSWHRVLRGHPLKWDVIRRPVEPGNRYVAIWRKDNTDALHDEHMEFASFQDYKAAYDKIFPQGWRLHDLVANVINGAVYYNAVWRPGTFSETQVYGKTHLEYKNVYDTLYPQGWRLHILQSYVLNGVVLYNAVWRKDQTDEFPVYGATYANYRTLYDAMWPAGWRLHVLQSYVLNGQVLYNAVFRPTGGGEIQYYAVKWNTLCDANETLKKTGWRLSIVQGFVVNGQALYNAVWTPGTVDDTTVFDATYSEFTNQHDSMRAQGWRLYRLDLYHY